MKTTSLVLSVIFSALAITGCNDGGGGGGQTSTPKTDPLFKVWYDVYGDACNGGQSMRPAPGCNFYSSGYKIALAEDNLYTSNDYYMDVVYAKFGTIDYTDSYGNAQTYSGKYWLSEPGVRYYAENNVDYPGTGILYDEHGFALNNARGSQSSRDMLGDQGEATSEHIEGAATKLADRYALSSETSHKIATSIYEMAVYLETSRRRTQDQKLKFAQKIFGIDFKSKVAQAQFQKLMVTRELRSVDPLVERQAQYWGTDPETVRKVDLHWGSDYIRALSLK